MRVGLNGRFFSLFCCCQRRRHRRGPLNRLFIAKLCSSWRRISHDHAIAIAKLTPNVSFSFFFFSQTADPVTRRQKTWKPENFHSPIFFWQFGGCQQVMTDATWGVVRFENAHLWFHKPLQWKRKQHVLRPKTYNFVRISIQATWKEISSVRGLVQIPR